MKKIKLSEFLKDNNCYDKFIDNFDKEFNYEMWKHQTNECFSNAFQWGTTKENFEYWCEIEDRWCDIVKEDKENDMIDFFDKANNLTHSAIIIEKWLVKVNTINLQCVVEVEQNGIDTLCEKLDYTKIKLIESYEV